MGPVGGTGRPCSGDTVGCGRSRTATEAFTVIFASGRVSTRSDKPSRQCRCLFSLLLTPRKRRSPLRWWELCTGRSHFGVCLGQCRKQVPSIRLWVPRNFVMFFVPTTYVLILSGHQFFLSSFFVLRPLWYDPTYLLGTRGYPIPQSFPSLSGTRRGTVCPYGTINQVVLP